MNTQTPFDFSDYSNDELTQIMDLAAQNNDLDSLGLMVSEYDRRQATQVQQEQPKSALERAHDSVSSFMERNPLIKATNYLGSAIADKAVSTHEMLKAKVAEVKGNQPNTFNASTYDAQALAAQQPNIAKGEEVPGDYQTYDQAKMKEVDNIIKNIGSNKDYWGMSREDIYNSLRKQDALEVGIGVATLPVAPTTIGGSAVAGGLIAGGTGIAKDLTKENAEITPESVALDTTLGAVTGGTLHSLGSALGGLVDKMNSKSVTKTQARNLIRKEIKDKVDSGDLSLDSLKNELMELAEGADTEQGINLIDSGKLDSVLENLSKGQKVDNKIIDALNERANAQLNTIKEHAKPRTRDTGIGVGGTKRVLRDDEVEGGVINTDNLKKNLTDDLNTYTAPLYKEAYSTPIKMDVLSTGLKQSDAFKEAFKLGKSNAKNLTDKPSNFEILDQTKRALDKMINESKGTEQVGLIRRRDELVNVLRQESPLYAQALDTQSQYRNEVIAQIPKGESFMGLDADTSRNVISDLLLGDMDAARLGMTSKLKERIKNDVRTKEGKLLTDKQAQVYQRMLNRTPEQQTKAFKSLISTEAATKRTAKLAEMEREPMVVQGMVQSLIRRIKGEPHIALSALSVAVNPNLIGASVLASKLAKAKGKELLPKESELVKEVHKELFSSIGGSKKEVKQYLDDFLALDFEKVPSDIIKKIVSIGSTKTATDTDSKENAFRDAMF